VTNLEGGHNVAPVGYFLVDLTRRRKLIQRGRDIVKLVDMEQRCVLQFLSPLLRYRKAPGEGTKRRHRQNFIQDFFLL
jgi:hypothetical protein